MEIQRKIYNRISDWKNETNGKKALLVRGAFCISQKHHGLRKIRFHDLRHSCASLLLANNVPMKQIQEWLGHSLISTTAESNLFLYVLNTRTVNCCLTDIIRQT